MSRKSPDWSKAERDEFYYREEHDLGRATTKLFDALHSYIRISEETNRLLSDNVDEARLNRCRALLKEIEGDNVDPFLDDNNPQNNPDFRSSD